MLNMEMKVDWKTWDERMTKLQKFPQHVQVLTRDLTEQAVTRLIGLTPRSEKDARHLADRWTFKVGAIKNEAIIEIYNTATSKKQQDILGYLERGTHQHPIPKEPKPEGKWLAFEWLGRLCFAKQVQHPGTKANWMIASTRDWLDKKFEMAKKILLKNFTQTWREK